MVTQWVERGDRARAYPRRIFKFVYDSNESNHLAKQVLNICMNNGELKRLVLDRVLAITDRFDDFEAIFMPRLVDIVYRTNELFGFTRKIIRRTSMVTV